MLEWELAAPGLQRPTASTSGVSGGDTALRSQQQRLLQVLNFQYVCEPIAQWRLTCVLGTWTHRFARVKLFVVHLSDLAFERCDKLHVFHRNFINGETRSAESKSAAHHAWQA